MKKKIIWTVAIIIAIALVAFKLMSNKEEMEEAAAQAQVKNTSVSVVATHVKKDTLTMGFKATGNFEPSEELTLSAESSGRVEKILIEEGDNVKVGQLVAVLGKTKLIADLQSAEANLAKAKKDLARYEDLEPKGGVTKQQLDGVRLDYQNAVTRVKNVKKELSDTDIRASINGVINQVYIEEGSYLSPGSQVADIVNVNTLKMVVKVSEREVIEITKGQKVTVWADVLPDEKLTGKVSFIGVKADNSLRYPVEIQFENSDKRQLRSGMFGSAKFSFDKQRQALVIPRDAIEGSLKEPQVYQIKEGKAILRDIKVGTINNSTVEVLNGVSLNDQIVVDGQINLQDGDSVTVTNQ